MDRDIASEEKTIMTNEEKEEAIKRCLGQEAKMIDINDTFDFQCQQCGQCCMNRQDIILNPFDVYQIAKHENVEPEEIMKQYCIADLGRNSRIPMVLLNCDMEPNHWCPFLKLDMADGCKFKCTIHDCSPGACQNHPIGAMFAYDMHGNVNGMSFCKVEQCDNSKGHNSPVKVGDWLKRYIDHKDEIGIAHKIQTLVTQYYRPDDFMIVTSYLDRLISIALEDKPEGITDAHLENMERLSKLINTVTSAAVNGTINIGYLHYDTSKPFIEQAEENIQALDELYTHVKELYDKSREMLEIPDDVDDVKKWVLHDSIRRGALEQAKLPKDFIDMIKEKVEKGEL